MSRVVPWSAGLVTGERAAERLDAVAEARSTPIPSSRIATRIMASCAWSSTCTREARVCLAALATASDTA
jgi:hypothetical protein